MLLSGVRSDGEPDAPLSFEVIRAIANAEGVEPTEIEPPEYEPLYEVVDPEALDALFTSRINGEPRTTGRVTFTYCDYQVTVTSEGDVQVSKTGSVE